MSTPSVPPLRVVVCGDNGAVPRLLHRGGYEVIVMMQFTAEVVALVERERPDVVVIEIAACGALGLGAVSQCAEASPQSAVIVLSPFEGMRLGALGAGALEMIPNRDLRPLLACVAQIRREAHGGIACACCAGVTTAVALDPDGSRLAPTTAGEGSAAARGGEGQPNTGSPPSGGPQS